MLQMITLYELAETLRVHPSTVYRALKRGEFPAVKVGRDWRFEMSEIEKWVAEGGSNHGKYRTGTRGAPSEL